MMGRKKEGGTAQKCRGEDTSAAQAGAVAIAEAGGRIESISDFISHSDEASRKRLEAMNQRLRELELQMEALEAEISKASSLANS